MDSLINLNDNTIPVVVASTHTIKTAVVGSYFYELRAHKSEGVRLLEILLAI